MSRNKKIPHTEYGRYLVAYLDIIGFEDMIKNMKSASTIARILEKVHKIASWVGPYSSVDPIVMSHFSDTIVVTVPYNNETPGSPYLAMINISLLQATLTKHDCFLRGAIAIGKHYQNTKTRAMFGSAYLKAYKLEKTAIWPRVILDRSALRLQKTLGSSLSRGDDGLVFIDYLKLAFDVALAMGNSQNVSTTTPFTYRPIQFIDDHKDAILRATRGIKDVTILQKYHYLASYHNKVVKTLIAQYPPYKLDLKPLTIRLPTTFPTLYP